MQIEYSKAGFKEKRILENGKEAQKNVLQTSVVLIGEKDLAADLSCHLTQVATQLKLPPTDGTCR